jgi:hypothetical protein
LDYIINQPLVALDKIFISTLKISNRANANTSSAVHKKKKTLELCGEN